MPRPNVGRRRKTLWLAESADTTVQRLARRWGVTTAEAYRRVLKSGLEHHLKELK